MKGKSSGQWPVVGGQLKQKKKAAELISTGCLLSFS
jgi:hypothetical protein